MMASGDILLSSTKPQGDTDILQFYSWEKGKKRTRLSPQSVGDIYFENLLLNLEILAMET